jgi:antitoxin PrlF
MTGSTLTSNGRITVPANVRAALKVKAGDRVEFVEVHPGRFEIFAANRSVKELKGMFGKPTRSASIEHMNQAIASRGVSARCGRDGTSTFSADTSFNAPPKPPA